MTAFQHSKRWLTILTAIGLIGTMSGCYLSTGMYDDCGPLCDGCCNGTCDPNYRSGSILSSGVMTDGMITGDYVTDDYHVGHMVEGQTVFLGDQPTPASPIPLTGTPGTLRTPDAVPAQLPSQGESVVPSAGGQPPASNGAGIQYRPRAGFMATPGQIPVRRVGSPQ